MSSEIPTWIILEMVDGKEVVSGIIRHPDAEERAKAIVEKIRTEENRDVRAILSDRTDTTRGHY